ncbi:MAG: hypothetical protein WA057_01610 [Candidatus Magasanikiibacteriota bacterium]
MKKKESKVYPKLACEVCGHKNQLCFCPLKRYTLLYNVVCDVCKQLAYWANHYKSERELLLVTTGVWDKRYIKDIVDFKFGPCHGHKKPKSRSI